MLSAARIAAAASVVLLLAGCKDDDPGPPAPLPTAAAGPMICGELIPRAVAELMAGQTDLLIGGKLEADRGDICTVSRGKDRANQVFTIRTSVDRDHAAETAFRSISRSSEGTFMRLPPAEGYGVAGDGITGVKGRRAFAYSASGEMLIRVHVESDAVGRDPIADARALLNLIGPKVAPAWPAPPKGIDPLNPTSPPPTVQPSTP